MMTIARLRRPPVRALATLMLLLAPHAVSAADRLPPAATLAHRVADAYAAQTGGVIGLRSQSELVVAGLGARRTTESAWYVYVDGTVVESGSSGGSIGAMEAGVHQPYQRRYVDEYRYAYAPCAECGPGRAALRYESPEHDAVHGSGVLVVDVADAKVLRADVAPYVVPRPARSGVVSLVWGAIANAWFPLRATGAFSGRIGPFGGTATLTQTFTEYRRYPDVASAERALGVPTRGALRSPKRLADR